MRQISAADANRAFSKLLRQVRDGETITVTSRGEPVAIISPFGDGTDLTKEDAKRALLSHLDGQTPAGISWTREELYD